LHPLHQFSQNSFRLYRLPTPKQGRVVGLIGRNGIGKSTAVKILAGELVPNLGNFEEPASYEKVIDFFKGKELQAFFENLCSKKISLSFKPQNIDEIPKHVKGKVSSLLEKVDEKNKLQEIAKELEIDSILGHDISKVSGGELQRIAIAAAMLKKAEIYFFDEPSSYLDIRQRLRIANLIRNLALEAAVIVVEHDLAVLDYLSDYINILYGKQSVYGVVSSTKSVLNGINEFLEGYLHDENIRFREKELSFDANPPQKSVKRSKVAEYPALEKSFKGFSLKAEAGELLEGEVIGILGPNAIGKTTFVKMLAGQEKPDKGKVDLKLKVAFKPQYLTAKEGVLVRELFASGIDRELFKSEINNRLRIEGLFDNMLSDLSGGELQRVSVALTLCRESNIILLDEPSAFLDVEDRLKVAETIKAVAENTGKPALVVDHDILFQDYVSDRLIVFSGTPAKKGFAQPAMPMHEGMNLFLKQMNVSFRRDPKTGRPRANKLDSVRDREQKQRGEYYYS